MGENLWDFELDQNFSNKIQKGKKKIIWTLSKLKISTLQ